MSYEENLISKIDELLKIDLNDPYNLSSNIGQLVAGTASLAETLYGPGSDMSKQVSTIVKLWTDKGPQFTQSTGLALQGFIKTVRADVARGLHKRVRRLVAGEVTGDFLALARVTLDEPKGKDPAAVLVGAAYEDVIRRMGRDFADVQDRRKLEDVLTALKDSGILSGAQHPVAQSFLQFRNKALHAEWEKIDESTIQLALAFVQEMLLKHYS